jgi:hypothetical protein
MLNPTSEPSRNIKPSLEQKRQLVGVLRGFTPEGARSAWDALAAGLERELAKETV